MTKELQHQLCLPAKKCFEKAQHNLPETRALVSPNVTNGQCTPRHIAPCLSLSGNCQDNYLIDILHAAALILARYVSLQGRQVLVLTSVLVNAEPKLDHAVNATGEGVGLVQ